MKARSLICSTALCLAILPSLEAKAQALDGCRVLIDGQGMWALFGTVIYPQAGAPPVVQSIKFYEDPNDVTPIYADSNLLSVELNNSATRVFAAPKLMIDVRGGLAIAQDATTVEVYIKGQGNPESCVLVEAIEDGQGTVDSCQELLPTYPDCPDCTPYTVCKVMKKTYGVSIDDYSYCSGAYFPTEHEHGLLHDCVFPP